MRLQWEASFTVWVGMQAATSTMEISMEILPKTKYSNPAGNKEAIQPPCILEEVPPAGRGETAKKPPLCSSLSNQMQHRLR